MPFNLEALVGAKPGSLSRPKGQSAGRHPVRESGGVPTPHFAPSKPVKYDAYVLSILRFECQNCHSISENASSHLLVRMGRDFHWIGNSDSCNMQAGVPLETQVVDAEQPYCLKCWPDANWRRSGDPTHRFSQKTGERNSDVHQLSHGDDQGPSHAPGGASIARWQSLIEFARGLHCPLHVEPERRHLCSDGMGSPDPSGHPHVDELPLRRLPTNETKD
jgi:hypothetical protein